MEHINKIIHGDCLEKLKELPDNSIDSIVTDPPYELGFMGKSWDNTGIAYNVEMWKQCLRVLKPGGHLLSFGGTRTYHRMACAIEDAGFEVRDMVSWIYGSGFPKSLNIGKAVDKLQGNEREKVGEKTKTDFSDIKEGDNKMFNHNGTKTIQLDITKGTSEWEGWGTALKPALEPITVARKPLSEKTVALNVLKWGTGGINIDGSRVEAPNEDTGRKNISDVKDTDTVGNWGMKAHDSSGRIGEGRFPANLIHDGSEEVLEVFPYTKTNAVKEKAESINSEYAFSHNMKTITKERPGDSGSASRFFYCAKTSKSERNKGLDSTAIVLINFSLCENNIIQGGKEAQLLVDMGILVQKDIGEYGTQAIGDLGWNTLLFGKNLMEKYQEDIKSTILTKTNSTTTLAIYNWLILLLTKEYIADVNLETETGGNLVENAENYNISATITNEKMALALGAKNAQSKVQLKISLKEGRSSHPTVKPQALMKYLITLITPKGGTVLDPFAGSGSTLVAAKDLGFNYIGIEMTVEYIPIIEARLK